MGITTVAWVLTSYNLVLALTAVPAAYVARRRPGRRFAAGAIVTFACGLAGVRPGRVARRLLVAARSVAGRRRRTLITAALDLLAESEGSDVRAARIWATAGILGAALGPALGGIVTQVLRLGVDLPAPGAAGARLARGVAWAGVAPAARTGRTAAHRERT